MGRKHHTEEQIIGILRTAEVVVSKGGTVEAFCRDQMITEATLEIPEHTDPPVPEHTDPPVPEHTDPT